VQKKSCHSHEDLWGLVFRRASKGCCKFTEHKFYSVQICYLPHNTEPGQKKWCSVEWQLYLGMTQLLQPSSPSTAPFISQKSDKWIKANKWMKEEKEWCEFANSTSDYSPLGQLLPFADEHFQNTVTGPMIFLQASMSRHLHLLLMTSLSSDPTIFGLAVAGNN
jgi:hypothetical protein